jgi:putative acetyltransferase
MHGEDAHLDGTASPWGRCLTSRHQGAGALGAGDEASGVSTFCDVELRGEVQTDWVAVRDLHVAAFGDDGVSVAALVDDLRLLVDRGQGVSLVAEEDGEVLGHVMFTESLLDAPRQLVTVQVLSPLAVLPTRQRQGVGTRLVRSGLAEMRARGVPVVFLEGSPSFYPRLGFSPGARFGFRRPSLRIPEEAFQAVLLPAYEPWMRGTLVYAQEFWAHDAIGLRPSDVVGREPSQQ